MRKFKIGDKVYGFYLKDSQYVMTEPMTISEIHDIQYKSNRIVWYGVEERPNVAYDHENLSKSKRAIEKAIKTETHSL